MDQLNAAKQLKNISKNDEPIILQGINSLSKREQASILSISKKLLFSVDEIDTHCDEIPQKRERKRATVTGKYDISLLLHFVN